MQLLISRFHPKSVDIDLYFFLRKKVYGFEKKCYAYSLLIWSNTLLNAIWSKCIKNKLTAQIRLKMSNEVIHFADTLKTNS